MTDSAQEARAAMKNLLEQAEAQPLRDEITVAGRRLALRDVIRVLEPYLTPARRARIEAVLEERTYTVATVVEGLVNTGNVSAVMRSAEGLGFQPFHVVTNVDRGGTRFKRSERISQGAEKWLDVHVWDTPRACVEALKADGYTVVVTHLEERAVPIGEIDFTKKTALVFGNELKGVSPDMLALADRTCIIPMSGFTQSFNISVAAAVSLYHARADRLRRQGYHGDLTVEQRERLQAHFYLKSVRHARAVLERFVREGPSPGGTPDRKT